MATTFDALQAFYLSSGLPNFAWTTDQTELRVVVTYQQDTLMDTSLVAVNGRVTLYESRELVERYMRFNALTRAYPLQVAHYNGSSLVNDASLVVIFCEKNIRIGAGNTTQWLEKNFLTTRKTKVLPTDVNTVEQLFFVQPQGTPRSPSLHVTYIDDQGDVQQEDITLDADYNASLTNLFVVQFSIAQILEELDDAVEVIAVTVSAGNRHLEYYKPARKEDAAFIFRNAFNVQESAYLNGVVTRNTGDGRKIGTLTGSIAVYDRINVTEYEMQTSPLSFEQAAWIDQLITSMDVKLLDGTPVVITDGKAQCHNDNAELNDAKFSYREADQRHTVAYGVEPANVFTVPPHSFQFS